MLLLQCKSEPPQQAVVLSTQWLVRRSSEQGCYAPPLLSVGFQVSVYQASSQGASQLLGFQLTWVISPNLQPIHTWQDHETAVQLGSVIAWVP